MCRQVVIIQKKVSSRAICLDIIEIYVYSNILGSIACYLAHK